MRNPDRIASELYARRMQEILAELKILGARLEKHAASQSKHPENHGYIGDLAHVRDKIRDINSFLKP